MAVPISSNASADPLRDVFWDRASWPDGHAKRVGGVRAVSERIESWEGFPNRL